MLAILAFLIAQDLAVPAAPVAIPAGLVKLNTGDTPMCSGVFAEYRGRLWLITADHCMDLPNAATSYTSAGETVALRPLAEGVARFPGLDLAMIPIPPLYAQAAMKAGSKPPVAVVGFPGGDYRGVEIVGKSPMTTTVCVTSPGCKGCPLSFPLLPAQSLATVTSKTQCVEEGHSGGAVLDERGGLVGITSRRSGSAMAYLPVAKFPQLDLEGERPTFVAIQRAAKGEDGGAGVLILIDGLAEARKSSALRDDILKGLGDRTSVDLEVVLKDLKKEKPKP